MSVPYPSATLYPSSTLYPGLPSHEESVRLVYTLEVDWARAGTELAQAPFTGEHDDLSAYLQGFSCERGRSSAADPAFAGAAEFTLHDPFGRLNPRNTASDIYPDVRPGRAIRLRVRYKALPSPEGDGPTTIWQGIVTRIRHEARPNEEGVTHITAAGVEWAIASRKVDNASPITGPPSQVLQTLLEDAGAALGDFQDSLDTGYTFPAMDFEDASAVTYAQAVGELMDAERGQLYFDRQGRACYDRRHYREGSPTATSVGKDRGTLTDVANAVEPSTDAETIRNRVTVTWDGTAAPVTADDATSQAEFGVRDLGLSAEQYVNSSGHAGDLAAYILAQSSDPAGEAQRLTLRMSSYEAALAMFQTEINDYVRVADVRAKFSTELFPSATLLPGTAVYPGVEGSTGFWVEGIAHSADPGSGHTTELTLTMSPPSALPTYTSSG